LHRPVELALFTPIYWGFPGHFAPAGGFDDAAVDGDVLQVEADDLVVGIQADLLERLEHLGLDPLITSPPDRRGRTGTVSDLGISGAEDQDLNDLVEHEAIADPGTMTPQRVIVNRRRQQRGELVPQRLDDERWQSRHGHPGEVRRRRTPLPPPGAVPVPQHRHAPYRRTF